MTRSTITLSDERYQALKEAPTELVAKARLRSDLGENDALALAVEETRLQRLHQ